MPSLEPSTSLFVNSTIGVGFGTAAIRHDCYNIVTMALEEGFRKFDTAEENEWWYDQTNTGRALKDFFEQDDQDAMTCQEADLRISTKIPPWKLTSIEDIRQSARDSRLELVGFCADETLLDESGGMLKTTPFPLDVYYIHAPECWRTWHPRCENPPPIVSLREAWMALEYVVSVDRSSRRIGLSNVRPDQLRDIIEYVQQRLDAGKVDPPPRMPDVLQAYADPIRPAEELRKICEENFIEFVSYSTLGTQHRSRDNPVLGSNIVQSIAAKHARSTAEVVLSWALQLGMSVIPRSSKREHIAQLARLLKEDGVFLDENDINEINKLRDT